MTRHDMIQRIGNVYMTSNIEGGEYSNIQEEGSRVNLENALGRSISHFKLDIRFDKAQTVVLIETKQSFKKSDEAQLAEYLQQERALHYGKKINAILANTNNDEIKVWKSAVDDEHILSNETVLHKMEHYVSLIDAKKIDEELKKTLDTHWSVMDGKQLRAAIESTLDSLLEGSDNKAKKIELLQKNVLNDQKVKNLL